MVTTAEIHKAVSAAEAEGRRKEAATQPRNHKRYKTPSEDEEEELESDLESEGWETEDCIIADTRS